MLQIGQAGKMRQARIAHPCPVKIQPLQVNQGFQVSQTLVPHPGLFQGEIGQFRKSSQPSQVGIGKLLAAVEHDFDHLL